MAVDLLRGRPDPIIVLGMHRSGTSAVSALLGHAGVNMGLRQEANGESRFFLRINHWMLTQLGASWATPGSLPDLSASHIDALASMVRRRTRSWAAVEHFGRQKRAEPWGFKDPRSTLLFPVYDRLFPDAKLLLVTRHGVDVAQSLRVRSASAAQDRNARTAPLFGVRQPGANRLHAELLTSDLERNFRLWVSYQDQLRTIADSVGSERALCIRFEDLVTDAESECERLAAFLGLDKGSSFARLDAGRAYAHRSSAELAEFAAAHAEELAGFGY